MEKDKVKKSISRKKSVKRKKENVNDILTDETYIGFCLCLLSISTEMNNSSNPQEACNKIIEIISSTKEFIDKKLWDSAEQILKKVYKISEKYDEGKNVRNGN
jgi:hypothetical protein